MSNGSEVRLQNLLATITDSLFAGQGDVESLTTRYQVDLGDDADLVHLIDTLCDTFSPVEPSPRFVRRLQQDLIGDSDNVLVKVRRLPPRVHIAAGLALVAGFVILRRRRSPGEAETLPHETAAAQ